MRTQVLRPTFSENQILSAADVNGIVSHARDSRARHNRYLHNWGVAQGLTLEATERQDPAGNYVEVSVSPGMAIDGNGREIVVTEAFRLSEDVFDQLNVAESVVDQSNPPQYPVFISGRDQQPQASSISPLACQPGGPTRTLEGFEVTFGRVGDAAELDKQPLLPLGQGISTSSNSGWKVLLGFVQWDGVHFSAVTHEDNGIQRRYVGVKAEDLAAQNDRLTLRSADRSTSDKAALVIDNENDGEMRFGLQNSTGQIVPVFTVNAKGDVTAEGMIRGAIAGGVQIESGVITDGAVVPLPAGITQQQIDNGHASIQIHVTPRYQQPGSLPGLATNEYWTMQPLECYVDQNRQAICQVRWEATGNGADPIPVPFVTPGVCDYQIFGFVKDQ